MFNQKSWVWLRFNDPLNKLLLLSPGFFPPAFVLFVTEVSWSYFWAEYVPRGEVGWPAFHRGNVPTDTAPVEEEQVGSDVFLLGWHLGQSFFGWQIVVEKQPSDSLWNNGGGIKF